MKLFVSLGNTVKVPSVVGYNQDAAEDALTDAGFEVSVVTREAEDGETPGTVKSQKPGGNKHAKKGSTVQIIVLTEKEEPSESPSPSSPSPSFTFPGDGDDAARNDD
ncbi:MAG: PASTA domain-containing protein [Micromonosporaceae bacterium]|nr:PASTA domain-containing protein [Micromonosporaceae bacterium]